MYGSSWDRDRFTKNFRFNTIFNINGISFAFQVELTTLRCNMIGTQVHFGIQLNEQHKTYGQSQKRLKTFNFSSKMRIIHNTNRMIFLQVLPLFVKNDLILDNYINLINSILSAVNKIATAQYQHYYCGISIDSIIKNSWKMG